MDILMLTSVYPQPDDGEYKTTPTVKYFCEEWAKMGYRVVVIQNDSKFPCLVYHMPSFIKKVVETKMQIQIPNPSSRKDLKYINNGVVVYRKNLTKYLPHGAFPKISIEKQGNFILSVIEEENLKPDIIIGHWVNPQLELLKWLKKHYNSHYITSLVFHNDCEERDVETYNIRENISYVDVIGCRNERYGRIIKERLKLSYFPFICYSGIPNSTVYSADIKQILEIKQPDTYLYVGRIVKYKRLDSVIDALYKFGRNKKYFLTIIGEGNEKESILATINDNKMSSHVSFIDKLPRDEVFEEMKKNEIFTLISENETFGMVYLEAMLMGCITIASKGCALDGIIIDGENGFLCEQGNAVELERIYNRINEMSENDKHNMMIKAHNTALQFSDHNVAARYLDEIHRLSITKKS